MIVILIIIGVVLTAVGLFMGLQNIAVLMGKDKMGDMKQALIFTGGPLAVGVLFIILGATLGKSSKFTNIHEEEDKLI